MTGAGPRRSFGANSRMHAQAFLAPCLMAPSTAYASCPTFRMQLGKHAPRESAGRRAPIKFRLEKLPRMADFALWGSACETAFWPPGTFMRAYDANREAAIAGIIEADPVATFVREIMAERSTWAGRASDLLRAHIAAGVDTLDGTGGWPRNPRA